MASAAPHLVAAVCAGILFITGITAISWYSKRQVARHVYELAGARYTQKDLGLVVQEEAVRRPDVLPIYGSSEIDQKMPNHARELFADAPTGFSALAVAGPGTPIFLTLQNLGALGRDLRGRKVVISLSPPMFQIQEGPDLDQRYRGNFSPLHAMRLMLSPDLSATLKRQLARRLLARPALLERNPVLALTVRAIADDSAFSRPLYYALLPLATAQRRLLDTEDRILVLAHLLTTAPSAARTRPRPRPLDWPALLADASAQVALHSRNQWTVDDAFVAHEAEWTASQRSSTSDEGFLKDMAQSDTALDLEQLLQVLGELNAEPLLLSMPFHGAFMDYRGVSAPTRRHYYALVRELAARYHARTAIFDELEAEPYFFDDLWSHPSAKGWVYYDRALDAFYHDALD